MIQFLVMVLRALLLLIMGGCGAVVAGVSGRELHWLPDLLGHFLLPAIMVGCAGALLAGLLGKPLRAVVSLMIAVTAALVALPWTLGPKPLPATVPRASVLLFNVWYRNEQMPQVEALIRKANADLVILLEVTPRIRSALQGLDALYPHRLDCLGNGACDILVLSRSRVLPVRAESTPDGDRSPVLTFSTKLAGCEMPVIATHLTRPYPYRPAGRQLVQAAHVAEVAAAWAGARLVAGDFNAAPWGNVMQSVAGAGRVKLLTGSGGTWPSVLPPQMRIPIDHLLTGEGLSFTRRTLLPATGSDHVPVLAEIAVTDYSKCR